MRLLSDPLPCSNRAALLCTDLNNKLCQSLNHIIEVNASAGHLENVVNLAEIKKKINNIHLSSKSSPCFYALNTLLVQCCYGNTKDSIQTLVSLLSEISNNSEVQFTQFNDYIVEVQEILRTFILQELPKSAAITSENKIPAEKTHKIVKEALEFIQLHNIEYYKEMMVFVSEFMILSSKDLKAGSSFDLFGMIYINENNADKSILNMCETLIHEAAHLHLYSVLVNDPLTLNENDKLYYSPIKKRERPMAGVYHAAFVLARVVNFLQSVASNKSRTFMDNGLVDTDELNLLIEKYYNIASESLEIIHQYGKLTELGGQIMKATSDLIKK